MVSSLLGAIAVLSLSIHLVTGTSILPKVSLRSNPDKLVASDRDGFVFVSSDGDIHKYSTGNLSLLSTTSTATNATGQHYVNKLLEIVDPPLARISAARLLLACWQNQNQVLKCVYHRMDDLRSIQVDWHANNKTTFFKTYVNEQIQAISCGPNKNHLLIVTSRSTATEDQLDQVINVHNEREPDKTYSMPAMGLFRAGLTPNRAISLDLTTVLPYNKQLQDHLLLYDYIYSFYHEDYIYFILNDIRKPKSSNNIDDVISNVKIARICTNDTELWSYTEIPLTCNNQDDLHARVAYLDISKPKVDQSLHVISEKITYGDAQKQSSSVKSFLCSYTIRLIQDVFHKAISDCHDGLLTSALLDKLHPESKQASICQKNPSKDWCTSATNPYIDGYSNRHLVKEDNFIQFDGLSSPNFLHTLSQGHPNPKDVYFIGTKSGLLTKISADQEPLYTIDVYTGDIKNYRVEGEKISEIFLIDAKRSRQGASFSTGLSNIYSVTDLTEIYKIPMDGCQFYTSCLSCLTVRDPLKCVWCGDQCSTRDECGSGKISDSSCPPIIESFDPQTGPTTGGTRLTIKGDNFGTSQGSLQVKVAQQECLVDKGVRTVKKIICTLDAHANTSSHISVEVNDDTGYIAMTGSAISNARFNYVNVHLFGLEPRVITILKKSLITIHGANLDAGSHLKVSFGEIDCELLNVTKSMITCALGPTDRCILEHSKIAPKVWIDGSYIDFLNMSSMNSFSRNFGREIEIQCETEIDLALVKNASQGGNNGLRPFDVVLTLILITALVILVIYITRYDGFSQLRMKLLRGDSSPKNDLEGTKLNFRGLNGNQDIHTGSRPSESLSGLIKLNDLSSDYFNKIEQQEQDKPLMHDLVDDEMMSILEREKILVDRNRLTLGHVLGSGQFGRVYKGFLKVDDAGEHATVAVKTLHNRCHWDDSGNHQAFLDEGLMMKDFDHENVLALIGVAFDSNGLPMVITPFMLYGDLRSYISDEASSPTVKELIEFGIQVARGMAYLSGLKFVHRDLAARNCMLDENLVVKVADFGLSRDIYERDYYSSDNKKAKLPVKWMAIESLEKSVYSIKTDVWSYGVLLWELMTRGVVPYPDVDNFDLFGYLKEGRRMLRPRYCPVSLYRIMQACWSADPEARPTFSELVVSVSNVIVKLQEAKDSDGQQKVSRDETYCDVVR